MLSVARLKRLSGRVYLCAGAMGLLLAPTAGAGAVATCSWKVSPSVAPKGLSWLFGVDGRTRDDVWAVGVRPPPRSASTEGPTLTEHWDGKRWSVIPTPRGAGVLLAVTAISPREAWAVGARGDRALIERWDGTRWRIVPSPNVGRSVLNDIDATSSGDAWAVGNRAPWDTGGSSGPALIEHWDGRHWRVVASANQKAELELHSVSVSPSGDVWAVGETPSLRGNQCVERWDGSRWRFVPVPAKTGCFFPAIDAIGSRDVWIDSTRPLRWDGRHWHASGRLWEILNCAYCQADSLAAISDRDVWIAGTCCDTEHSFYGVYIAHWNGARWQRVHAPLSSPSSNAELNAISAVSADELWAVGDQAGSALVEHYACSR